MHQENPCSIKQSSRQDKEPKYSLSRPFFSLSLPFCQIYNCRAEEEIWIQHVILMQCQLQWRSCSGKRFPEQRAIMVFSAHNQTPTADGFERTPTPEQLFTPRTHAHSEHCQTGITPLNTWTATLKRIKRQQRCPNKHSEHTWVVAGSVQERVK